MYLSIFLYENFVRVLFIDKSINKQFSTRLTIYKNENITQFRQINNEQTKNATLKFIKAAAAFSNISNCLFLHFIYGKFCER